MTETGGIKRTGAKKRWQRIAVSLLCAAMLFPHDLCAAVAKSSAAQSPETEVAEADLTPKPTDELPEGAANAEAQDSVLNVVVDENSPYGLDGKIPFNPEPNRAVWLSALFPGLGQIYNRRYWKLPIIVGGFMGLGYATSWNNKQFQDYSQGYRDLLDADPTTNSYMNFFPPNTSEADLDQTWLTQTMESRKDYYRRNRDLCIICLVGLYLLCMVDAYVDASLAHFDISPSLSMDLQPAMMLTPDRNVAVGLNWAFNF